ncbi:MAG: hypothetical protein FD168_2411 [Desulfobulbaceae bacterium]|jgi:hypothetical protein|nr:MAG: hypothetical protein FD168_2411 [Desulfobulbaceae bacterium]
MKIFENVSTSPSYFAHDGFAGVERRNSPERRKNDGRRSQKERRLDSREAPVNLRKTIKIWFLALIHLRLGVDRRKNGARRQLRNGTILTREELADLLS